MGRVLREIRVAQDPIGHPIQAVDRLCGELPERVAIALAHVPRVSGPSPILGVGGLLGRRSTSMGRGSSETFMGRSTACTATLAREILEGMTSTLNDALARTVETARRAERDLFGALDATSRERPIRPDD